MAAAASALRVTLLASLVALAACGGDGRAPARSGNANAAAPARALEGQLDLLAVSGALPGDALREFTQDTGCKVRAQLAAGPAELLELASAVDADLVLASGENAASLVSAGRVRVLDAARLPEVTNLPTRLRNLPGAVVDGRRYGMPWRWQPNVLAYDSQHFTQAPASWSAVFAPSADAGAQVLAAPEPVAIADAAIYLAATQPALGIGDPYALDERQYAAALALLKSSRGAWRGSAGDADAASDGFRNGVLLSTSTPAMVRSLQAEGLPVAWTLPAEGGSAQVEIAMLHSESKHPNCALAWMQWALAPATQARLAALTGALPVDNAACQLEPLAGSAACARDGMALLPRLYPQHVPQARCGTNRCVPYSRWTRDYLALVGE